MSKGLKVLIVILIAIAGGGYYAWHLYNKPVASTVEVKTELAVTSEALFSEYESDEAAANAKYLDKFIEVTGVVRSKNQDDMGVNLVLEAGNDFFGINCAIEKGQEAAVETINEGDKVTIKGKCAGFNGDVVLVGGIVVK